MIWDIWDPERLERMRRARRTYRPYLVGGDFYPLGFSPKIWEFSNNHDYKALLTM